MELRSDSSIYIRGSWSGDMEAQVLFEMNGCEQELEREGNT